jgi:hypothetical protein
VVVIAVFNMAMMSVFFAALRAEAQEILTAQKDDIQKVCEKVLKA